MATTSTDRILSLDEIRGIAVMGIFSVNVVGMAMIEFAYFYPPAFGFDSQPVGFGRDPLGKVGVDADAGAQIAPVHSDLASAGC